MLDELKKRGTRMVFLMGGEPLLHKDFDRIVDYVKALGMECDVTTNGLLIPQHLEALKKIDLLMVSLDGNREGNDLNRGRGTFDRTTHGIELAKQNGIPIRINCVLTKNNINDVEWLLDYANTLNAYVGFTVPAKCPALEAMGDKIMSREEVLDVHRKLLELKKKGAKITLSKQSLEHVLNYPRKYDELVYKTDLDHKDVFPSECPYGRYIVFIDASGYVYPCTTLWEFPSVFKPKSIFKDGFDEALRNAQELPCWICYCAGGTEWDYMSSWRGVIHAIQFSLTESS